MEIIIDKAVTYNQICKVCLSSDRTLTPLGKYLDLFTKICPKLKPAYKSKDILLCWECHMVLQKVEKFQEKALKAQSFFKSVSKSSDDRAQYNFNLSTLHTVLNTEINYFFLAKEPTKSSETIDCDAIKKENDNLKYTDELFSQNDFCDEKVENVNNIIKEEKIDINEEILNDLFNLEGAEEFKDEIDDDHQYDDLICPKRIPKKKKHIKQFYKTDRRRKVYRIVYNSRDGTKNSSEYGSHLSNTTYDKVPIEKSELMSLREKEKTMAHYLRMEFKCELCVIGYASKSKLTEHMYNHNKAHAEYECRTCHQRFEEKRYLDTHTRQHMHKYQCQLCDVTHLTRRWMMEHIRHAHDKAYECVNCGMQFREKSDVFTHYKTHKEFKCDHCGKKTLKKHILEKHMIMAHLPHVCKICNVSFKRHETHLKHIREKHVKTRTEEAFCVECNMQFDNVLTYKRHLNTSVKHRPKSNVKYPCPECHKLFNKKMNMKYHYNYFHTDRTNFYCDICAKYFLNNYQLRRHKAVIHDKIKPPKNKFCPHCGRGFSERRILNNHIRTHTGERPFVCALCAAAFTQAYPLTTHMRAVHKLGGRTGK